MRRITLVLFVALISNLGTKAEVLDPNEALARAMNNTQVAHRMKSSANAASPRLVKTYSAAAVPAVYVFNRGNNAGFMVIAADDAVTPILAYSDEGDVDTENVPDAVAYWLDTYVDEIAYRREQGQPDMHNLYKSEAGYEDILPMCKTSWGQVAPYNRYCPDGAVTGCVATAYAQILKTFNYPQKGNGSYSYTWNGQTLSYDYENDTFDWDNMLDSYVSGKYTDEQADAVAKLMYACGVACDMNYGPSSATGVTAPIINYELLGLSSQITFVERDYYTQSEWENLIYNALKVGPVMYAGQNSVGGHEFVCDGYRNGFFHINWGWDGVYNGYFLLSALDGESSTGTVTSNGYNMEQNAVLYMQPSSKVRTKAKPNYQMTCESFTLKQSSVQVGKVVTESCAVFNKTTVPINATLDMKITDLSGNEVAYLNGPSIQNAEFGAGYAYSVRIPATLKDGAYIISPGFTVEGEEPREISCKVSGVQSYTMIVSDGVCTFTPNTTASIDVSDFVLNTPIYEDEEFNVTAEITNSTNKEYNGFVAVALVDDDTNEVLSVGNYVPLTVPVDGTVSFEYGEKFSDIGTQTSNYHIVLIDKQGNELSEHLPVDVTLGAPSFALTAANLTVANADNVNRFDISISVDVTCSEGYFNNALTAYVFPSYGGYSVGSLVSGNVFITEGETETINFHGQISKLQEGVTYMVQVSTGDNVYLKKSNGRSVYLRFTVGEGTLADLSGVNDVSNDSEVVKTEYYTLQGVSMGAEVNAPGVYVKVETLTTGERRSTRCAIRN